MKKPAWALCILSIVLMLCACGGEPDQTDPSAGSTGASQSLEDQLLEIKFQAAVDVLEEYLLTGAVVNESGVIETSDMTQSEVFQLLYNRFADVSEHPGAEQYLERFFCVPDVPLSMRYTYIADGMIRFDLPEDYAYDAQGQLLTKPTVSNGNFCLLEYIYSEYHGKVDRVKETIFFLDSERVFDMSSRLHYYVYYDDGTLKAVTCDSEKSYYDEQGRLYQQVNDPDERITGTYAAPYTQYVQTDYQYDAQGLLTDTLTLTTHTSVSQDIPEHDFSYSFEDYATYTYNDAGQCVARYEHNNYNDVTRKYTCEYDGAGNPLREVLEEYHADELYRTVTTTYTYENGKLMQVDTETSDALSTENGTQLYTYGDYWMYDPDR